MDIPEIYIKMAEKAEEIQKFRLFGQNKQGDYFWLPKFPHLMITSDMDTRKIPDGAVWLPLQHQLQAMVTGEFTTLASLVRKFHDWYFKFYAEQNVLFTSMEQLWLSFVMKERYSKVWNGTEWVKG